MGSRRMSLQATKDDNVQHVHEQNEEVRLQICNLKGYWGYDTDCFQISLIFVQEYNKNTRMSRKNILKIHVAAQHRLKKKIQFIQCTVKL